MFFCAAIFLLVVAGLAYWGLRKRPPKAPPGPPGVPFLGFAPFMGDTPWKVFAGMREKYGNVMSFYLGKTFTVVLQDYDAIREAFINNEETYLGRPELPVVDYFCSGKDGKIHGILALEAPKWQPTRSFILDTLNDLGFGKPRMENIILDEADHLTNVFQNLKGQSFDPSENIHPAMMSIIGMLLFGRRFEYESAELKDLVKSLNVLFAGMAGGPLNTFAWLKHVPGQKEKWLSMVDSMQKQWDLIEHELVKHEKTYSDSNVRDFIDAYFRHVTGKDQRHPLAFQDKQDLIPNIMMLLSAPPEATTTSLLWIFLHLCHCRSAKEKVQEEIDRVVGRTRPVMLKDREMLPYTMATMYESWRLGGNTPLGNFRSTLADTELYGYHIPKRTMVIPNIWAAHRDAKYFPDPMTFKPERFLDSSGQFRIPPQFIIFALGKRACPGKDLAPVMVFLMFANIMQRFDILPARGLDLPSLNDAVAGVSARTLPYKIEAIPRL